MEDHVLSKKIKGRVFLSDLIVCCVILVFLHILACLKNLYLLKVASHGIRRE